MVAPTIDPAKDFWLNALLAFIMMSGMALYDTCTDGLALDTMPEEEEGLIQGFMAGGRAAGMVVVSAVLGLVVQNISWTAGFYSLAVVTILPVSLVLAFQKTKTTSDKLFDWKAFRCFRQPNVIGLGILGALYSFIIYSANQLVNPFLSETLSIDISTAGYIAMVMGIGIVTGGLIGGNITSKTGQKKSVQSAMVLSIFSIALLAAISNYQIAWLLVLVFGFAFGFYETVFFAISMRVTDERIAATMFSILMAVANIGTGIGLGLTGGLSEWIGFRWTFLCLAVLNILVFPLLNMIFNGKGDENC
jgi:PAT family beta-lactamase induction signal transducer AmpG